MLPLFPMRASLKRILLSWKSIDMKIFYTSWIILNQLSKTTACVYLHPTFQLRQCAHPLADFPLVYRLYTAPPSLTPALLYQSRTCTSKTSITFDSVSQSSSLTCCQATTALLWRDLNPLTYGLYLELPHMIPVIIISEQILHFKLPKQLRLVATNIDIDIRLLLQDNIEITT